MLSTFHSALLLRKQSLRSYFHPSFNGCLTTVLSKTILSKFFLTIILLVANSPPRFPSREIKELSFP